MLISQELCTEFYTKWSCTGGVFDTKFYHWDFNYCFLVIFNEGGAYGITCEGKEVITGKDLTGSDSKTI